MKLLIKYVFSYEMLVSYFQAHMKEEELVHWRRGLSTNLG